MLRDNLLVLGYQSLVQSFKPVQCLNMSNGTASVLGTLVFQSAGSDAAASHTTDLHLLSQHLAKQGKVPMSVP